MCGVLWRRIAWVDAKHGKTLSTMDEIDPQPESEITTAEPGDTSGGGRPSGHCAPLKKRVLFVVKLVVTLTLVAWIVRAVEWSDIGERFAQLSWTVVAVVLLILALGIVSSALKWQQLLAVHGAPYKLWTLIRWYFIAFFLGQFLPSMIGGDAYRVYKTLDNPAGKASAALAIFVERLTGLAALLTMGWIAAVILLWHSGDLAARWLVFAGGGCAMITLAALGVLVQFKLLGKVARSSKCPKKLRTLIQRAWEYRRAPGRMAVVGLLSLWFHGSRAGIYTLLFWALAEPQGVMPVLVVLTITTIVSMLPISLNGYGLVDGSFVYLMSRYGASEEAGLAVMMSIRLATIPIALVGGVFYFTDGKGKVPRKSQTSAAIQVEA